MLAGALEAMAAGLPLVASRTCGLAELVPAPGPHPPGDVAAIAERIRALWRDAGAGADAHAAARRRARRGRGGAARGHDGR
jgi:glycosyltransferase involved in cell wall biosynthesis